MVDLVAEKLADEVRQLCGETTLPIDPRRIAEQEGIVLAPSSNFGSEFHGRLEYHSALRLFLLYFPVRKNGQVSLRTRFSICHELGHYYIDAHRETLLRAGAHNSTSGFFCDNQIEREADAFAAALLMPRALVKARIEHLGFLDLETLLRLSDDFATSLQCAAVRYCLLTEAACVVVIARKGIPVFQIASTRARASGVGRVKRIPDSSVLHHLGRAPSKPRGKDCWSTDWLEGRGFLIFEESVCLAEPEYTLTTLRW